jgi:apolipoprotein N-acyltransferase
LLVNLLLYQHLLKPKNGNPSKAGSPTPTIMNGTVSRIVWYAFGIGPFFVSIIIGKDSLSTTQSNIVVVQPNVDPYSEKFSGNTDEQIARLISLSEQQIDDSSRLVVWPETAVPAQIWENNLLQNGYYQPIIAFVRRHPQLQLVTGIDSYRNFGPQSNGKFSMRYDEVSGTYYEAYNTAMSLDARLQPQLYHKSKLVPGVEGLPSWLGFLGKMFESFGGINGTLGTADSVAVFNVLGNPYRPAPVICYESIYGDYLTQYIRRGANVITIITNDGWWSETPGYRQHQSYARLRAIETGCWVARSANTGISCFIDPNGQVYQPQPWSTPAVIKMKVPPTTHVTFFARQGDYLSRIAAVGALLLLILTGLFYFRKGAKPASRNGVI